MTSDQLEKLYLVEEILTKRGMTILSNEERMQRVFGAVFGESTLPLEDKDGLESVPGWDSVGQLNVVMALEAEFDLEFEADEMVELTSVAAIRRRLAEI